MRTRVLVFLLAAGLLPGCSGGSNQPDWPELHPVKGVVKKDGQPVKGGSVRFTPDPDRPEFAINGQVGDDGTFTLTTVRTTDKSGERKTGAPAGNYKVAFTPLLGEQGSGQTGTVELPKPVTVASGANDITIDLPAKK
jgi:hypothetical protein